MSLTLATARTLLRRRLQEPTADQWTNAELDTLINLSISYVQKLVQALDPEAFVIATAQNIVSGTRDYDPPTGAWNFIAAEWVGTTETIGLENIPRYEILAAAQGEVQSITRFGKKLRLTPTPSESVTSGLLVYHVPSLSVAADGDVLPFIDPLHGLVVLRAEKWAIGETGEASDEVQKQIDEEVRLLPLYYQSGASSRVTVDVDKGY